MLIKIFFFISCCAIVQGQDCFTGNLSIPFGKIEIFKTIVEIWTTERNTVANISYFENATEKISTILDLNGNRPIFIVKDSTILSIAGATCNQSLKNETTKPYDFWPLVIDPNYDRSNKSLVFTLQDLFDKIRALKFFEANSSSSSTNQSKNLWTGQTFESCQKLAKSDDVLKHTVLMRDNQIRGISIFVSNTKTNETSLDFFFRLSPIITKLNQQDEEMFLPPRGVYCKNSFTPVPKLPQSFSGHLSYTEEKIQESNNIYFDVANGIVSFGYGQNLTDFPLGHYVDQFKNLTAGFYKIVHNFNNGLQYIINTTDMSCSRVSPIANSSLDGKIFSENNDTTVDAFQILFSSTSQNFTLVGKRYLNNKAADVYITNDPVKNETRELWYYKTEKAAQYPALYRVYRTINSAPVLSSQQVFYEFQEYKGDNKEVVPWYQASIEPCLGFVETNSSLVLLLTTEKDAQNINRIQLREILRAKVAEISGVNSLRIVDFFFQPVNETEIYAFFKIAERSDLNGTRTKIFRPEISLADALEKLNVSLEKNNWDLKVPNFKVVVAKNSLNLVPPFFKAQNVTVVVNKGGRTGFSGGAMTVLAFFMLLIGGVAGFGFAYFLWKRNRGFQYQIYE